MLALVAGEPVREGRTAPAGAQGALAPEILQYFILHRRDVVIRRTTYELQKARERAHILEGFRIALDHIDEIISIIRASDSTEMARERLIGRFAFSLIQSNAILDMRLRALTSLERQKIEDEYAELIKLIAELEDILASERRISAIVKVETQTQEAFRRRTPHADRAVRGRIQIEDMIPDTPVVVTSTDGGYIKRVSVDTFRAQNRGGRGVIGISNLKREDVVRNLFHATTHQHILFFTTKGRAYRLRAYEIPDSTRQARGTALVNLLTLPPGENVTRSSRSPSSKKIGTWSWSRGGASSRNRGWASSRTCAGAASTRSTSTKATSARRRPLRRR